MANQPTKYRKFIVGAASAALVASAVAPVASAAEFKDTKGNTHETAINALVEAGIVSGYPDGTFLPNKTLTRSDVVKFMGKWLVSLGYEVPEDYKTNPRFTDQTSKTNDELLQYSALVKDHGVFNGYENGSLGAAGDITRENMAIVLVRAFDAINDTDLVAFVAEQDFKKDVTDRGAAKAEARPYIDVLDYFDITNPAAPQFNPKATTTRGQFASFLYKTSKVEVEEPVEEVVTATKVESVSATNLKEVEVTFDGTVDEASATNEENYSLATGAVDYAELLEDGKTVRLTLVGKLANQVENEITVKNVKAGDKTVSVTDFAFTPIDNTLPTVSEVRNLGTKAIKVVFSEPIEKASVSNFKVDGKAFFGTTTQGSRELILTPYESSTLSVGEHTLTVAGVEDYFGLKALSSDHKFTVVEDKVAPTVTAVEATLERVVVTFSEEVDPSTVSASNVYWKSGDTKRYANGTPKKLADNKYEFTFTTNPLPAYETILNVEGVKDYSGNQISETQVKVTAQVDQVRPTVTEVKADSANAKNITVKFSKAVDAADKKYFTVLDEDGKVQPISLVRATDSTNKVFVVELYNDLAEGTNTIKVSGVKDKTTLQNTMLDYQTVISVKDTTPPKVVGVPSVSNSTRSVVITFNEQMDLATLANPSNYLIGWSADGSGTGTLRQLPAGTEITPVQGGKAVILSFPAKLGTVDIKFDDNTVSPAVVGTIKSIQVMGVKDAAGNILNNYSTGAVPVSVSLATLDAYSSSVSQNAVFTDKNTVKVKFNQAIGKATATDFVSSNPAVTIQSATADGSNVVTLKLAGNTSTSNVGFNLSTANPNNLETVNGNKVAAGASISVKDQVKPEVKLADAQTHLVTVGNTIQLPFSEALTTDNQGLMATDLVVTNLATNKTVTLDKITTTVSGSTLNIQVTPVAGEANEYSVKVKSGATYIKDQAGNTAVESATYETVRGAVDGVAPTLSSASLLDLNNDGNVDTLKVTFSEAVNDSTLTAANFGGYSVTGPATTASLTTAGITDTANDNVLYLTVSSLTGTAAPATKLTVTTAAAIKDLAGNPIAVDTTGISVADAAGAVINATANYAANVITVSASEELSSITNAQVTVAGSELGDYSDAVTLVAGTDYTVALKSGDDSKIEITLTAAGKAKVTPAATTKFKVTVSTAVTDKATPANPVVTGKNVAEVGVTSY